MIRAKAPFDALAQRLTARAAALALACAARRRLVERNDARRWRRAALIWPLSAKG